MIIEDTHKNEKSHKSRAKNVKEELAMLNILEDFGPLNKNNLRLVSIDEPSEKKINDLNNPSPFFFIVESQEEIPEGLQTFSAKGDLTSLMVVCDLGKIEKLFDLDFFGITKNDNRRLIQLNCDTLQPKFYENSTCYLKVESENKITKGIHTFLKRKNAPFKLIERNDSISYHTIEEENIYKEISYLSNKLLDQYQKLVMLKKK